MSSIWDGWEFDGELERLDAKPESQKTRIPKIMPSTNGHSNGSTNGKYPPSSGIAQTDAWILEHPDEAHSLLKAVAVVTGNSALAERHDLRIATIPTSTFDDTRRYGIGLGGITAHMGAILPGELVVVGAREGNGKTALAEKIALANARDHRVLFCTLDQPREKIRDRFVAKKMRCSLADLRREQGELTDRFLAATELVNSYDLPLWQPAKNERTIRAITDRAENLTASLLVIDYTRRIGGWKPGEAASDIMDYLADWTHATNIATVLLSQLNRDAAGRRPTNAHFQDTGKLEQSADRCILLHRPFLGLPAKDDIVEIVVSKNREGPCFKAHAWWNGAMMEYGSMDEADESRAACCQKRKKDD